MFSCNTPFTQPIKLCELLMNQSCSRSWWCHHHWHTWNFAHLPYTVPGWARIQAHQQYDCSSLWQPVISYHFTFNIVNLASYVRLHGLEVLPARNLETYHCVTEYSWKLKFKQGMTALFALPVLFTSLFFYTYCDKQSYVLVNCVGKTDYLKVPIMGWENHRYGKLCNK